MVEGLKNLKGRHSRMTYRAVDPATMEKERTWRTPFGGPVQIGRDPRNAVLVYLCHRVVKQIGFVIFGYGSSKSIQIIIF